MASASPGEANIKVLLIGDSGVGKTCIMLRFSQDTFSSTFITTVGVDYKFRPVEVDGQTVALEVWDTAGQERFKAITRSYLRGAHGILLVFDVTDRRSFKRVQHWMQQIEEYADLTVDKLVVGNKCDLSGKRMVTTDEGREMARQCGLEYIETSAKENVNVTQAFQEICRRILARQKAARGSANQKSGAVKVGTAAGEGQSQPGSGCAC